MTETDANGWSIWASNVRLETVLDQNEERAFRMYIGIGVRPHALSEIADFLMYTAPRLRAGKKRVPLTPHTKAVLAGAYRKIRASLPLDGMDVPPALKKWAAT